ncbi:hypothetical protein KFZ58_18525 [Virgibacillus sp. NKC19-16]|uniref:hypothetical protein n=1 Tax=Virgibacillus salidurans TaxID=2831673 RepID=UPI001F19E48E|nr:hypothetical protein [Virgibacillus sp. NKC19-16]UJL46315.1 hypothetical protein KFZ58_18525 [Virgibacillus sp. NKC19-16]
MDPQFLSIEEFNHYLSRWNGRDIKITKHEMGDLDETHMELQAISYDTDTRRIDDYQPMHVLELNGNGEIETTTNTFQPLPSPTYEIPLEDTSLYEFDGAQFLISTDRAVYKIESITPEQ